MPWKKNYTGEVQLPVGLDAAVRSVIEAARRDGVTDANLHVHNGVVPSVLVHCFIGDEEVTAELRGDARDGWWHRYEWVEEGGES